MAYLLTMVMIFSVCTPAWAAEDVTVENSLEESGDVSAEVEAEEPVEEPAEEPVFVYSNQTTNSSELTMANKAGKAVESVFYGETEVAFDEANTGRIITESEILTMSGAVGKNVKAVFQEENDRLITFYGKTTGQYKFNARYEYTTGIKAIAFVTYKVGEGTVTVYSEARTVEKTN